MKKQERKYLVVLALAFALAVAVEVFKPQPIDWTMSFEQDDRRPYGSLILFDLLPELFPGADVEAVSLPPFLALRDTTRTGSSYLFVTRHFAPDPAETRALVAYAARGNTVFAAAYSFDGTLADTLHLATDFDLPAPSLTPGDTPDDSLRINFVSPAVRMAQGFGYKQGVAAAYFERFDTLRTTVLGVNSLGAANYVRVEAGAGAFYLSTVPLAFTNYYLLYGDNAGYVYRALSYLPAQAVRWDAYHKPGRNTAATPLRFVLQDAALRGAYYVLLALVLLFVAFEARRRQRVIPIIAPPQNTTLEFVITVGRLYFQHGDHANLAEKKITYFLDYVRTRLRLPTGAVDDEFLARVAERSGVPADEVRAVFACIAQVQGRAKLPEADLGRLNRLIEGFYRKSKR